MTRTDAFEVLNKISHCRKTLGKTFTRKSYLSSFLKRLKSKKDFQKIFTNIDRYRQKLHSHLWSEMQNKRPSLEVMLKKKHNWSRLAYSL